MVGKDHRPIEREQPVEFGIGDPVRMLFFGLQRHDVDDVHDADLQVGRKNHDNMHVRGFNEEGTTTTPFDMVVLNRLDRFHLAMDVIERVPGLGSKAAHVKQHFRDKLTQHRNYVDQHGEDMPGNPKLELAVQNRVARRRLTRY
jgi:phosphoketolase